MGLSVIEISWLCRLRLHKTFEVLLRKKKKNGTRVFSKLATTNYILIERLSYVCVKPSLIKK